MSRTDRIRMLNDQMRQNLPIGNAVMTPGIAALGNEAVNRLVKTVATFNNFCSANDPHGEHDFGSFNFDGQDVFFKIDAYDKKFEMHSTDPTDPAVTERVITLALMSEY